MGWFFAGVATALISVVLHLMANKEVKSLQSITGRSGNTTIVEIKNALQKKVHRLYEWGYCSAFVSILLFVFAFFLKQS